MTTTDEDFKKEVVKDLKHDRVQRWTILALLTFVLISVTGVSTSVVLVFKILDIAEENKSQSQTNAALLEDQASILKRLQTLTDQIDDCINPDDDECTRQSNTRTAEAIKAIVADAATSRAELERQVKELRVQVDRLVETVNRQSVFLQLPSVVTVPNGQGPQGTAGPPGPVGPQGPDVVTSLIQTLCQLLTSLGGSCS